jgi:mitochondrial import receptor subunit TOM20
MSSTSSSRTTTALAVAGATIVGGIVAYAAYFDYKRRNDAEFRRQLRMCPTPSSFYDHAFTSFDDTGKEKKKVDKSKGQQSPSASASSGVGADELRQALESIRNETVPEGGAEREQFFMMQVGMGEQLIARGNC